jgi:hypothetical protein
MPTVQPITAAQVPPEGHIRLGAAGREGPVHLDLAAVFAERLLVQSASGGGKSWTLRRILEQSFGRAAPVIIDPEGEYVNLAERFGYPVVRLARLPEEAAHELGRDARRHQAPFLLDATGLRPEARITRMVPLLEGLLDVPLEEGAPMLLVIDEIHLLAPQAGAVALDRETRQRAVATLTEVVARGRKRGLGVIAATQRLAKLAQHVAAEFGNLLIGRQTLDRDVKRAGDLLGWNDDRAAMLRELCPGDFVAAGRAITGQPTVLRIGGVETRHVGATPALGEPELRAPEAHAELLDLAGRLAAEDMPEAAAVNTPATGRGGPGALHHFLARDSAPLAARIIQALIPIAPNAAELANLAQHLSADPDETGRAVDLLETVKAVEVRRNAKGVRLRLSASLRRYGSSRLDRIAPTPLSTQAHDDRTG